MEKFMQIGERYMYILCELRDECVKYLTKTLIEQNGSIDVSGDDNFCSVTYDGGNHPEYASTVFSLINSIYLNDNEITFNLEDEEGVSVDRICTWDLYDVCDCIYQKFNSVEE